MKQNQWTLDTMKKYKYLTYLKARTNVCGLQKRKKEKLLQTKKQYLQVSRFFLWCSRKPKQLDQFERKKKLKQL